MPSTPEARKLEEAEFHDRLRAIYETDPELYAKYTSNQKFYSVVHESETFYFKWLRANATGKKVLDFGSGHGWHTTATAQFAAHVTGIDISPEGIKIGQEYAESQGLSHKVDFMVMDAEALTFPPHSFDVVTVRGVLHHMDLDAALKQINRVLVPKGKAIFLEALANNPLIHAYRKRTPHLRTAWEADHILRFEDSKKMRKYFQHVEVRTFHLAVLAAVPLRTSRVFNPVRNALDAVDRVILRVPGLERQGWMGCFVLSDPIQG